MYIPKPFEISVNNEIYEFIDSNAFGQLISSSNGKLTSTHLPFILSEDKTKILSHLALPNLQHHDLEGQEVLITLEGPHDYISPTWYSSPGVPTWNYQAVHIYGRVTVFNDADKLKVLVNSLTNKYESQFDHPWRPEYKAAMLNAIVGVEVTISEVQCKFKLSQNRSAQDRLQVIEQLKQHGSIELAAAMEQNESKLAIKK